MRIITAQFDYPGNNHYAKLLKAFRNSCKVHAPDSEFICLKLKHPKENLKSKRSIISNTIKLKAWLDELEKSDTNTLLVDCDMLMTAPIDDIWYQQFDIAYTYREDGCALRVVSNYKIDEEGRRVRIGPKPHPDAPRARSRRRGPKGSDNPPYNGGVMFIRPNKRSLNFMRRQLKVNNMMFDDPTLHSMWRGVYAGINQAAFGYMMEKGPIECDMKALSCTEWNSCDDSWGKFKEGFTRMLHLKGALRSYVLGVKDYPKEYKHLKKLWEKYEKGVI
jgi:hypothetical protein